MANLSLHMHTNTVSNRVSNTVSNTLCPTHCVQHSVSNTVSKHEEKIKTLQNYNFTNTLANTHNVPSQESHDISVVWTFE